MTATEKFMLGLGTFVAGIAVITVACLLMAYPVKWCWNYTMPYLFHLPEIGALQGFCLNLLGTRLFKATVDLKCKHGNKD